MAAPSKKINLKIANILRRFTFKEWGGDRDGSMEYC